MVHVVVHLLVVVLDELVDDALEVEVDFENEVVKHLAQSLYKDAAGVVEVLDDLLAGLQDGVQVLGAFLELFLGLVVLFPGLVDLLFISAFELVEVFDFGFLIT